MGTLSKQQQQYFRNSKVRDKSGNLLVCYHGTERPGFKSFDARVGKSQFGEYKFDDRNVNYFTTSREVAAGYTELGYETGGNVYACYVNIENPYVVGSYTEGEFQDFLNIKDKNARSKEMAAFDRFWGRWEGRAAEKDLPEINRGLKAFWFSIEPDEDDDTYYSLYKLDTNAKYGAKHRVLFQYSLGELFGDECRDDFKGAVLGEDANDYSYTTDQLVRLVLMMNEQEGSGYDGIIIPNIRDVGPKGSVFSDLATDVITIKSANQIKRIDNLSPTESDDIDESLQDGIESKLPTSDSFLEYSAQYLLPNGRFLLLDDPKTDSSAYDDSGDRGMHGEEFDFLKNAGLFKSRKEYADYKDSNGWIEVSDSHPEEDSCVRIMGKEPTDRQYASMAKFIDFCLSDQGYVKIEIGKNLDFYKAFCLDAESCPDYVDPKDMVVGSFTGDSVVRAIRGYFSGKSGSINESAESTVSSKSFKKENEGAIAAFNKEMDDQVWKRDFYHASDIIQNEARKHNPEAVVRGQGSRMEISIPEEKSEFKIINKDGKEETWEISLIREIERGKDGTKENWKVYNAFDDSRDDDVNGLLGERGRYNPFSRLGAKYIGRNGPLDNRSIQEIAKKRYDELVSSIPEKVAEVNAKNAEDAEYDKRKAVIRARIASEMAKKEEEAEELLRSEDPDIDDVIDERYDKEPLTSGTRVGGYIGHSKSASADDSEKHGSRPMSHWTKDRIFDTIEEFDNDEQIVPFFKYMKTLPLSRLRDIVLYQDGWHHTGMFYSQTDFYSIKSPRDIVLGLRGEFKRNGRR